MGHNPMAVVLERRESITDSHRDKRYETTEAEIRAMQLHSTKCQAFAQPLETGQDRERPTQEHGHEDFLI